MSLLRQGLTVSFLFVAVAAAPALSDSVAGVPAAPLPPAPARMNVAPSKPELAPPASSATWHAITFRGIDRFAPPGVFPLTGNLILIGNLEVEFPSDVDLDFSTAGEVVLTLAKDATPRSWVVRVGRKKMIASPFTRIVVPFTGLGDPRFEKSSSAYRVPAPREFLDKAYDLKDPFDASPFR